MSNLTEVVQNKLKDASELVPIVAKRAYEEGYQDGAQDGVKWDYTLLMPYYTQTILATVSLKKDRLSFYEEEGYEVPEDKVVSGYYYKGTFFADGKPLSDDLEVIAWIPYPRPAKREEPVDGRN